MSAALIISLLEQFGPPAISLITGLIAKLEAKGNVSSTEWSSLTAAINLSAQDHMIAQLKAQGVDLNSPLAVALIAAAGK